MSKSDLHKLVLGLLARPESSAFREPVDWKALGLDDYPDIVARPMDLGTIKKNIETNQYLDVEDIANDIRLVWTNCMLYNRDGSEFYHLADTFARAFEDAYSALKKQDDSKSDMNRVPSVDEKLQLSYDVFKIDNLEMGRVITMIEEACPSALSKKESADEMLINFDGLTPKCFHDVRIFVGNCIVDSVSNGKSKKRKPEKENSTTPKKK